MLGFLPFTLMNPVISECNTDLCAGRARTVVANATTRVHCACQPLGLQFGHCIIRAKGADSDWISRKSGSSKAKRRQGNAIIQGFLDNGLVPAVISF